MIAGTYQPWLLAATAINPLRAVEQVNSSSSTSTVPSGPVLDLVVVGSDDSTMMVVRVANLAPAAVELQLAVSNLPAHCYNATVIPTYLTSPTLTAAQKPNDMNTPAQPKRIIPTHGEVQRFTVALGAVRLAVAIPAVSFTTLELNCGV
jgi:hypothetical protein